MSSTGIGKSRFMNTGGILILAILVAVAIRSRTFIDPYGFIFVLVGGIALVIISFPGAEIHRAFLNAIGSTVNEAEIRESVYFWEAAGRGFWMLGVLRGILNLIMGFAALAVEENGLQLIMKEMSRSLLAVLYGILLAVICFIPCWKLMGKRQSRPLVDQERRERPSIIEQPSRIISAAIGYVLFIAALYLTTSTPHSLGALTFYVNFRPSLLVVLGGTLALMLFMGKTTTGPTLSTAFAGMGFIGSLVGCIEMLFSIATVSGPPGIAAVAGALVFVLSSCLAAQLGMILVGAPLEDRALRMGQLAAPTAFSRVAWYVFPLLSLIFLVVAFVMIITPLPKS